MEIIERAATYAEGKANEAITKAIAQAYADGYRDGYKDREEEIPVDLRDNKTEYVDLGLPSGTLWAKDYEKENGETLYLPYGKAAKYAIPTEEQWNELLYYCKIQVSRSGYILYSTTFIGPNGNSIKIVPEGYKIGDNTVGLASSNKNIAYFWILSNEESIEKNAIILTWEFKKLVKKFSGYKLPLRLVRKK